MRSYITALMLLATLGLVSCGGGNDGASTGSSVTATPVVAKIHIRDRYDPKLLDPRSYDGCVPSIAPPWSAYANGGCGNNWIGKYRNDPSASTIADECACHNAFDELQNATGYNPTTAQRLQCAAIGGYYFGGPGYYWCQPSQNPGTSCYECQPLQNPGVG